MAVIFPYTISEQWGDAQWNHPLTGVIGYGIDPAKEPGGMYHRDWNRRYQKWIGDGKPEINLPVEERYHVQTGAYPDCKSDYGVFDLDGGLSEAVIKKLYNENGRPFRNVEAFAGANFSSFPSLKCEFSEDTPGYKRRFYTGFRCCSDPID